MGNKFNETEGQTRLRRAKESLTMCMEAETNARKSLTMAAEATKLARAKYHDLSEAEEKREYARRMHDYRHCTN